MKASGIVKDGREAAYLQVARELRNRLSEGKLLRVDGRLPSYRQLADKFGVSICVIQQAMRLLREESLIEVHHGKTGRVLTDPPVETGILKLGLIHPYASDAPFGRQLPYALLKSIEMNGCNAMISVRSSERNPVREREIAENLLYNGFDGILLSPEDSFTNAAFFEELSRSTPVMLLDQAIPGSFLPAVVVDFADGGNRIGHDLRRRGCRRLLALLSKYNNSSIRNMLQALEEHIEVRQLELPIYEAETRVMEGDYSMWDQVCARLHRAVPETAFRPGGIEIHRRVSCGFQEIAPGLVNDGIHMFPVVHAGALQVFVFQGEPERLYQMEPAFRAAGDPPDVARILGNFRRDKDNVIES